MWRSNKGGSNRLVYFLLVVIAIMGVKMWYPKCHVQNELSPGQSLAPSRSWSPSRALGRAGGPGQMATFAPSKIKSHDGIHVAVAVDMTAVKIVRALLASAATNTPNTFIHIVHTEDEDVTEACHSLVTPDFAHMARCVLWDPAQVEEVRNSIKVVSGQGIKSKACAGLEGCDQARAKRLFNVMNFARFFLADILPDLDRVIWMDCDVIMLKPMDDVWRASMRNPHTLVSAFVEPVRFGRFYIHPEEMVRLMDQHFTSHLDLEGDSFNDGVIVINLARWRESEAGPGLMWLLEQHRKADPGLWKYGTQPIMMLLGNAFGWNQLEGKSYYGDLGFEEAEEARLHDAVFLHFDGEKKPWKNDGINKGLWQPFMEQDLRKLKKMVKKHL